jgi:hypothetical protein
MSEPPEENESMTTVPSEPTTEAGRRVRAIEYVGTGPSTGDILAIEAEARADAEVEIAELREALRQCEEAPYA